MIAVSFEKWATEYCSIVFVLDDEDPISSSFWADDGTVTVCHKNITWPEVSFVDITQLRGEDIFVK